MSNGACMEISNLAIQPYQSKFTYGIPRPVRILGNLSDFFKQVLTPNKFSPNSKSVCFLDI
jgi:hypothetical protein